MLSSNVSKKMYLMCMRLVDFDHQKTLEAYKTITFPELQLTSKREAPDRLYLIPKSSLPMLGVELSVNIMARVRPLL